MQEKKARENIGLNAHKNKCYISYRRVSTRKQGQSGLGLDGQMPVIEHFTRDGVIIADFEEVQSAKTAERPILKKAITMAKSEDAILIVAKADRLSRDVRDALAILDDIGEQRLICCDCPSTDRFTLTIIFAVAERERLLISLRTKAALAQKRLRVADGRDKPYNQGREKGFKHSVETKRKISNARRKPNDKDGILRKLAIERRAAGLAYQKIADELTALGFTAPMGGALHPGHISRIIK